MPEKEKKPQATPSAPEHKPPVEELKPRRPVEEASKMPAPMTPSTKSEPSTK